MSEVTTTVSSRNFLKSIILTSDYEFLPEGVRVFKKCFDQRMNAADIFAKIDYKYSGHFFEITCGIADFEQVWKITHTLYTNLIETEKGDPYEPFNSNLIAKILPRPDEIGNKTGSVRGSEGGSEVLIPLDFKSVWQCHTEDLSMEKIIPMHVQVGIERITGTRLVEDLNSQVIEVLAQSQEDCEKAMHKLEILRKYHDLAYLLVNHLFYTEEQNDYELCIRNLPDIKNRLVETTLIDPLYVNLGYEELTKAYKIRCCPFLHTCNAFIIKSGENLIPATLGKKEKRKGMTFDLWSGYKYRGLGQKHSRDLRANQFQLPAVEPLEAGENVRKWLAAGIPDDSNETVEQMKEDMLQAGKIACSSPDSPDDPDFNRMHASTVAQGSKQDFIMSPAQKPMDSMNITLGPAVEIKDFLGLPSSRRSIFRSPGISDLRTGSTAILENIRDLDISQSILDSDIQEDEQNKLSSTDVCLPFTNMPSSSGAKATNTGRVESSTNLCCPQSLLDSDIPEIDRQSLKSAGKGEGILKNLHDACDTALPTIREETGVTGRVFHQTIRQGVPRVDKGKIRTSLSPPAPIAFADLDLKKSTKEFADEMKGNVHSLLASLRNYNGEISLECRFGRMLIKPFSPSIMRSLEKAYSLPSKNMRDLLLRYPKRVKFTKAITTLPADVKFLLDMSIEETKQRIWSDAAQWTVKYQYVCCDHEDYGGNCVPGFVVEMDAENFETTVKSAPVGFGNLYVHCALRNWDYLISAAGSRNLEEDYGDLVQAIKGSTYIGSGSDDVLMSFELSPRYQIHFQSIRVRRHSQYKSYDGKTLLNIIEVHDLDYSWEERETGTMFFVSSSEKPNSVWYEMSLESVEANFAFRENLNLELGEETEWAAELLLASGVITKDICILANYIVSKMDGIGFYNDNGFKPCPADEESSASTTLPHDKGSGDQFW